MAAPIPPMSKYSIVYNLLNFPLILIGFVSKFIVCKVLYFKAQCLLRLCSPLTTQFTVFTLNIGTLQIFTITILKCKCPFCVFTVCSGLSVLIRLYLGSGILARGGSYEAWAQHRFGNLTLFSLNTCSDDIKFQRLY